MRIEGNLGSMNLKDTYTPSSGNGSDTPGAERNCASFQLGLHS